MSMYTTPAPLGPVSTEKPTSFPDLVTRIGAKATDHGDLAALIGGIVSAVLLVLICTIAVLMWCLSRHKGSYVTNETDEDDVDNDDDDDGSVASDAALQAKERLKLKEEE